MKTILLTRGHYAIVDDDDYGRLNQYKWYAFRDRNRYWRAVRNKKRINEKRGKELMSRRIMNAPIGMVVDHLNGDTLDNRKENLRFCKQSVNTQNQHSTWGLSKFKGVDWDNNRKKWRVRITKEKKVYHIGVYDTEMEAANAYDEKAKELFGEFAHLNMAKEVI